MANKIQISLSAGDTLNSEIAEAMIEDLSFDFMQEFLESYGDILRRPHRYQNFLGGTIRKLLAKYRSKATPALQENLKNPVWLESSWNSIVRSLQPYIEHAVNTTDGLQKGQFKEVDMTKLKKLLKKYEDRFGPHTTSRAFTKSQGISDYMVISVGTKKGGDRALGPRFMGGNFFGQSDTFSMKLTNKTVKFYVSDSIDYPLRVELSSDVLPKSKMTAEKIISLFDKNIDKFVVID